jgi:hypothetical protein
VPFFHKLRFEQFVIFYDPVMHEAQGTFTVVVRMGIRLVWGAVGSPARVRNAHGSGKRLFLQEIFKGADFARGLSYGNGVFTR